MANALRKVLIASPCPNCGVMIQKNAGCSHMVCVKCKHEFCWQCMQDYFRYRHPAGGSEMCLAKTIAYRSTCSLMILILLGKILSICFVQIYPALVKKF